MHSADYAGAPPGALAVPIRALNGGVHAWVLVDHEDYEAVAQYSWHLHDGYARASIYVGDGKRRNVLMHRMLLGLRRGDKRETDHINRDRLDNRRANLRVVTHKQNSHNQGCNQRQNRTSEYRGVSFHKATGKWWAYARINGVLKSAGYYRDEDEAGAAAAAFRRKYMTHCTD
jgi:hypothetical protein